jgi:hypothetical protein
MNKLILISLLITSSLQALPKVGWSDLSAGLDIIAAASNERYNNHRKIDKSVDILARNQKQRAREEAARQRELERAREAQRKALEDARVN